MIDVLGPEKRRRRSVQEKIAIVQQSFEPGMTVSLVARNLFFIYNAAPFDPDLVLSTGNDNQGIDVYGMPTVRSIGFNIKLEF